MEIEKKLFRDNGMKLKYYEEVSEYTLMRHISTEIDNLSLFGIIDTVTEETLRTMLYSNDEDLRSLLLIAINKLRSKRLMVMNLRKRRKYARKNHEHAIVKGSRNDKTRIKPSYRTR